MSEKTTKTGICHHMLNRTRAPRLCHVTWLILSAACGIRGFSGATVPAQPADAPIRVILFVADGAGAGHWGIAQLADHAPAVNGFDATGLMDTRGADHVVTGSAAAATALAIGMRSYRGAIGVGPDREPRETVLEAAEARGMATGLITTTTVSDATGAAFASHVTRRSALLAGRQFAASGVDILMGGGRQLFTFEARDSVPPILESFSEYTYVTTGQELRALDLSRTDRLLGLFGDGDMALAPGRDPSLAEMTETALTILHRNQRGFFLLVENEETDTQAHKHQPLEVIAREMQALDEAIRVGLAYQQRHPETLIVVTGDHETAGLSVGLDSLGNNVAMYHTGYHTAELIPVFANGPSAQRFAGVITNERVGQLLLEFVRH